MRSSFASRLGAALPILGSLAIAIGLIAVSYGHIYTFAEKAGAAPWEAAILAATVDGAIVVALAVIGLAKARGQEPPKIAKITLTVAVVATGAANLDHGLANGWRGVAAAVWVPLVAELAYLLAMATGQITRSSSVAMPGHDVEEDGWPVICTRVATVAGLVATMPPRPRPAVDICGGHLIAVATVVRPLADLRPVICGGHVIPVAEVTTPILPLDLRPVICGGHVAISEVAMPRPLADLRPEICTAPVTVAEVMAMTAVAIPASVATEKPAKKKVAKPRVATATSAAAREEVILEWLTDPDAPDDRMATATSEEVAALLDAAGHGHVSARTIRRDLQHARGQLATATT